MIFTCNDYISAAIANSIFCDNIIPNILKDTFGEDYVIGLLKKYCEESNDMNFNEDDENLPPIFDNDEYMNIEMNDNRSEGEDESYEMSDKDKEFYDMLDKIPNDKLSYIFLGEE